MEDEKKVVTLQTPSGEITFKEKTIADQYKFDDMVDELTNEEITVLQSYLQKAPAFVEAFVAIDDRTGDPLEDLDLAFTKWLQSSRHDAFTSEDVIRIVGSALGAQAILHLGVRWARVIDAHGSDIALVAENPPTRSFPFTSVQYRIEDNKTDFIVALFRSLEHTMKSASA